MKYGGTPCVYARALASPPLPAQGAPRSLLELWHKLLRKSTARHFWGVKGGYLFRGHDSGSKY